MSTCGIPSKIEELADLGLAVTLCISLHASNDNIRREIMPIARRYSIKEIFEALEYYHTMTNRRIIIEYTLIDGVNNTMKCAKELSELIGDLPCHVNLIKLNEVDGRDLKAPTTESCKKFLDNLNRFGVSATMRRTLGDDIEGACGQLRNKELQGENVVNKVKPNSKPLPNKNTKNKVKDVSHLIKSNEKKTTARGKVDGPVKIAGNQSKQTRNNKNERNFKNNKNFNKKSR